MHLLTFRVELQHVIGADNGLGMAHQQQPVLRNQQFALDFRFGETQRDTQQEPVQLRVRQREGAHQVKRVLGRNDEEWLWQHVR